MTDFDNFLLKLDTWSQNHHKETLIDKKKLIIVSFDRMKDELIDPRFESSNISCNIEVKEYEVTISISSAEELIISDYTPISNMLTIMANKTRFYMVEGFVVLELWFRCWEYIKKNNNS